MAKYAYDVVASVGEYSDKAGNKKKNYVKCGAAFTNDEGQISIKLDSVPVSPGWSGWLSLFSPRARDEGGQQSQQGQAGQGRRPGEMPTMENRGNGAGGAETVDGDDIPF